MKYQCEVIKDLLPLYVDDVCSKESKKIIEEHLEICDSCKQYYDAMKSSDNSIISEDKNNEILADSLQKVKKQIRVKHLIISMLTLSVIFVFAALSAVAIKGLKYMDTVIQYDNNIVIDQNMPAEWTAWYNSSGDDYFVHCTGDIIDGQAGEIVEVTVGDKTEKYLFFQLHSDKWAEITTPKSEISHQPFHILPDVTRVYYYPGYMMDVEAIAEGELPVIIETSTLLWEK